MKLIGSLTSPYVRKVRVVMAEKKLDYQLVLEDVWGSDAMLKMNPLGKVPCLVLDGGEAVFDSRVIVEYVDTLSPVGKLIPPSGRERGEVRLLSSLLTTVAPGALLAAERGEAAWPHPVFSVYWPQARADSFAPAGLRNDTQGSGKPRRKRTPA